MTTKHFEATHRHPPYACTICGYKVDASSGGGEPPERGNIAMCMRCTSVLTFGDGTLDVPSAEWWAEMPEEQRKHIDLIARAQEHVPRKSEHLILDTVVVRGFNDWRAAITFKNGHFLVSGPFNTRKKALKALRQARSGVVMMLKFADIQDVPLPHRGWYGQAYLTIFGREDPVLSHVGPYPTRDLVMRETLDRAKKLAAEMGIRVGGQFLLNATVPKRPAN